MPLMGWCSGYSAGHQRQGAGAGPAAVLTSTDGSTQALEVARRKVRLPPAEFSDSESGDLSLWLALLLAFAGNLVLNVMPCVLPIHWQ